MDRDKRTPEFEKKLCDTVCNNATFVNTDAIAYILNRSDLFGSIDKRSWCDAMPVLSAYDKRIMYVPLYLLFPEQCKKVTFFQSHKSSANMYDVMSFYSYVVLIGKKSFETEYDAIYGEQYGTEYPMTQTGDRFVRADATEHHRVQHAKPTNICTGFISTDENGWLNDYLSDGECQLPKEDDDDVGWLEDDLVDDDQMLLVYITEPRLVLHGSSNKLFSFGRGVKLSSPEIHVPGTMAIHLYGYVQNDIERYLRSSSIVLQDLIGWEALSTCGPKTFNNLYDTCRYIYCCLTSKSSNDSSSGTPEIDGNKLAIYLRILHENSVDTTTGTIGSSNKLMK